MYPKLLLTLIATVFISAGVSGKGFRLAPGAPLDTDVSIFEVQGRQGLLIRQKLRFGPFATTGIRRSAIRKWTSTSGSPGIFSVEHMQGRQSIRFSLTDGRDTVGGETVTNVRSTDLIIGDRQNSLPNIMLDVLRTGTAGQQNNLSGFFTASFEGEVWELFLDNTRSQLRRSEPAGFLRSDSGYYVIVPVWQVIRKGKMATLPFGAAGLEFRDEQGKACAAVSLIDGGEVYLGDMPEERKLLLAAACTALLLQSNID